MNAFSLGMKVSSSSSYLPRAAQAGLAQTECEWITTADGGWQLGAHVYEQNRTVVLNDTLLVPTSTLGSPHKMRVLLTCFGMIEFATRSDEGATNGYTLGPKGSLTA